MSRSYRMRYHGISDPYIADPIKIIVNLMTGSQHVLLSEHAGETFLDVKRALLPHLPNVDNIPDFGLYHIMFWMRGHGEIDDHAAVSSLALDNPNVVELELLYIDPIRVNISTFAGVPYTIFTRENETILDIKHSLIPLLTYLDEIPLDHQIRLVLDGHLDALDDDVQVSTLVVDNVINLNLLVNLW